MKAYTQHFFADRHQRTSHSASTILSVALETLPNVTSAVDVGCGVGTWLSVLRTRGVMDIQGIDGAWVDSNLLVIPPESFLKADLTKPLEVQRRFDLAISLEVAEHLPPECAEAFVATLVRLSDCVLFSAAIPHQGGRNHLNEQWQEYWAQLFARRGYQAIDAIRSRVWNDPGIDTWYKQNTLLFVKRERLPELRNVGGAVSQAPMLSVVHPDLYLAKLRRMNSIGGSLLLFPRAIKNWVKRRFAG